MPTVKSDDPADFMFELVKKSGVACTTVSDGHVILIAKDRLKELLASVEAQGSEHCVIFIKRNDLPKN